MAHTHCKLARAWPCDDFLSWLTVLPCGQQNSCTLASQWLAASKCMHGRCAAVALQSALAPACLKQINMQQHAAHSPSPLPPSLSFPKHTHSTQTSPQSCPGHSHRQQMLRPKCPTRCFVPTRHHPAIMHHRCHCLTGAATAAAAAPSSRVCAAAGQRDLVQHALLADLLAALLHQVQEPADVGGPAVEQLLGGLQAATPGTRTARLHGWSTT